MELFIDDNALPFTMPIHTWPVLTAMSQWWELYIALQEYNRGMVGWPVANVAATTAGFTVIYLLRKIYNII